MNVTRVIAIAVAFLLVAAAAPPTAQSIEADEQAVLRAEDQITEAIAKGDADTLEKLWAPDYTFINPAGMLLTRDRRLRLMRSGVWKPDSYTRDDIRIRVFGNTAVVTYHAIEIGSMRGTGIPPERRGTTVWVKRAGTWQAVAQETTPVVRE